MRTIVSTRTDPSRLKVREEPIFDLPRRMALMQTQPHFDLAVLGAGATHYGLTPS